MGAHGRQVADPMIEAEVLPVKTAITSALPYSVGLLFAVDYASWHGTLSWLSFTLPVLVLCQLGAMIGVACILSASGVFLSPRSRGCGT